MHAQGIALEAARRAGDPAGEAYALYGLAVGYAWSGRTGEAGPLFGQALRRFESIGITSARPGPIAASAGSRATPEALMRRCVDHPDAGELRAKLQPPGAQPESSPA